MPRWVFLLGVGLLLVAAAFVVTCEVLGPPLPGVTEGNVRRIKPGMTVAQVEAILGEPGTSVTRLGRDRFQPPLLIWDGHEGTIFIIRDLAGLVECARWYPHVPTPAPNPLDRLRKGLGW